MIPIYVMALEGEVEAELQLLGYSFPCCEPFGESTAFLAALFYIGGELRIVRLWRMVLAADLDTAAMVPVATAYDACVLRIEPTAGQTMISCGETGLTWSNAISWGFVQGRMVDSVLDYIEWLASECSAVDGCVFQERTIKIAKKGEGQNIADVLLATLLVR